MPQLLIETGTVTGYLIGGATAIYWVAKSFRLVAPLLSRRVARNLAISEGHRPRKRD